MGPTILIKTFVSGLLLGVSVSAPIGPVGILCIRRTLAEGRRAGFISGMGAATADAMYALIAGLGLSFVSHLLTHYQMPLRFIGGLFLLYLGIRMLLAEPEMSANMSTDTALSGSYFSTLVLTFANPLTIIFFTAAFGGLGLTQASKTPISVLILVLGVFLGATLWWLILCLITGELRQKMTQVGVKWMNKILGTVMTLFGLFAMASIFSSKRF